MTFSFFKMLRCSELDASGRRWMLESMRMATTMVCVVVLLRITARKTPNCSMLSNIPGNLKFGTNSAAGTASHQRLPRSS